jgi:hypothetical protein
MKYMITWTILPSRYREAVERFLRTSAPDVDGVTTLGRWHMPGSSRGWHVVEGTAEAVGALEAMWCDLLEIQISPVLDDAEAARSLAQATGS